MFSYVDPELNWEDLKWIREESKGASLVIKGIGSVEVRFPLDFLPPSSCELTIEPTVTYLQDAVMAIEAGVDGLVL